MSETWRPLPDDPMYEVSDLGRLRSWRQWRGTPVPRLLSQQENGHGHGYLQITLKPISTRPAYVHQLVLRAFVGPMPPGMVVRHLDGNPANNTLSNLAYGTHAENNADTVRHGRHHQARKAHCDHGHEFTVENTYWRSNGHRDCRACMSRRKEQEKLRRHERGLQRVNWDTATHCRNGHMITPEIKGVDKRGRRFCRACAREQSAAYNAKRPDRAAAFGLGIAVETGVSA